MLPYTLFCVILMDIYQATLQFKHKSLYVKISTHILISRDETIATFIGIYNHGISSGAKKLSLFVCIFNSPKKRGIRGEIFSIYHRPLVVLGSVQSARHFLTRAHIAYGGGVSSRPVNVLQEEISAYISNFNNNNGFYRVRIDCVINISRSIVA